MTEQEYENSTNLITVYASIQMLRYFTHTLKDDVTHKKKLAVGQIEDMADGFYNKMRLNFFKKKKKDDLSFLEIQFNQITDFMITLLSCGSIIPNDLELQERIAHRFEKICKEEIDNFSKRKNNERTSDSI